MAIFMKKCKMFNVKKNFINTVIKIKLKKYKIK